MFSLTLPLRDRHPKVLAYALACVRMHAYVCLCVCVCVCACVRACAYMRALAYLRVLAYLQEGGCVRYVFPADRERARTRACIADDDEAPASTRGGSR